MAKAYLYRNLNKSCFSVMQSGIVVAHTQTVMLTNVEFRVRPDGRQKCLEKRVKNVHASAISEGYTLLDSKPDTSNMVEVTYCPYTTGCFHVKGDVGSPVYYADILIGHNNRIFIKPPSL